MMENFGEKTELLRLSKFKLQLRSLISEVQELRERERSLTEQLHRRIQKQKQTEEENARKLQETEVELSSSNELRQKLERKVSYLENDNALLENKQKELKEAIQNLIQSKEHFVNAYEESTSDMKRAVRIRDRKLDFLSDKVKSHLSLFDSIEKEAFSVKQVVENVQRITSEREHIVADLRNKLDKVSSFETIFVEKICDLEKKLKSNEDDIKRKNALISELEARLEAAKISTATQAQIDEAQKLLSSRDLVIQNLTSEKEALHLELASLRIIIQKIQENLENLNGEEKGKYASILECTRYNMDVTMDKRSKDIIKNSAKFFLKEACDTGLVECTASSLSPKLDGIQHSRENDNMDSSVSETSCISATNKKTKTTQGC